MSSRIKRAKINSNHGDPFILASKRRDVPSTQQSRRQVAADRRRPCRKQHSDRIIYTLYTLVNGVTGIVDGNISRETFPSLNALFELDVMSDGEFS